VLDVVHRVVGKIVLDEPHLRLTAAASMSLFFRVHGRATLHMSPFLSRTKQARVDVRGSFELELVA
jgi:hypothetical protein